MPGHAQHVHVAVADLEDKQHVEPLQAACSQSTWKKSTASMLPACVRRNCRQLVSTDAAVVAVAERLGMTATSASCSGRPSR